MPKLSTQNKYKSLINNIGGILEQGRKQAFAAVNNILVKSYWDVGRLIVEYEQKGKEKAEYGSSLLDKLSRDLKAKYGKGFSRRNVLQMFLLKMGKGFTFVQRQFRMILNNTHFYVDLVFYHRILKCFIFRGEYKEFSPLSLRKHLFIKGKRIQYIYLLGINYG